ARCRCGAACPDRRATRLAPRWGPVYDGRHAGIHAACSGSGSARRCTMARLENPGRENLDAEGQAVYDGIVASRGGARGPFGPLLHNPPVAKLVTDLGAQLRFSGALPGADRELA